MSYRVIVGPRAENDIRAAAHWIREQTKSPAIAIRWVRSLRANIATLATQPHRCPIDPDSDSYGEEIRLLLHGKRNGRYRILFAIRGKTVHVVTVRHTSQRSLNEERDDPDAIE